MTDQNLLPAPPPVALELFGAALPRAVAYAEKLATDGVVRGLVGPHEVPRLWERHLLNCAALCELIDPGLAVVDVGSGAGLPGIVLAIVRPDLRVTLLEPLARRVAFLEECRAALELISLTVVRGRAEDPATLVAAGGADVVTARAVAPLGRLAGWSLPLLRDGGRLLAVKGDSASEEVAASRQEIRRHGGGSVVVRRCGVQLLDRPTIVVEIVRRLARGTKGRGR
jgi:16S rRNA (guanine527-N7)-methyltransferase